MDITCLAKWAWAKLKKSVHVLYIYSAAAVYLNYVHLYCRAWRLNDKNKIIKLLFANTHTHPAKTQIATSAHVEVPAVPKNVPIRRMNMSIF